MMRSNDSIDVDSKKKNKPIRAIFSDYDGTLCSARAARDTSIGHIRIPSEIREALQQIAEQIPVCIISSKDYFFLKETRAFARVISCLMGIETLSFASNAEQSPPLRRSLLVEEPYLSAYSDALEQIAKSIESDNEFRGILLERKFTSNRRILGGITVDWRQTKDWDYHRKGVQHFVSAAVTNLSNQPEPINLYLQKYDFHPFIDVYVTECSKGIAFDLVLSEISTSAHDTVEEENNNHARKNSSIRAEDILYLGDSENDNPAFIKAGVSIGVRSDSRLIPKLECQHILNFDRLARFLWRLKDNHLRFNEEHLNS